MVTTNHTEGLNFCILPGYVWVCRILLYIHNHKQPTCYELIAFCNGDGECLLRGTNWIYVCIYIYICIIHFNFILRHLFSPVSTTSTVFHNPLRTSTALISRKSRRRMGTFGKKQCSFGCLGALDRKVLSLFLYINPGSYCLFSHTCLS